MDVQGKFEGLEYERERRLDALADVGGISALDGEGKSLPTSKPCVTSTILPRSVAISPLTPSRFLFSSTRSLTLDPTPSGFKLEPRQTRGGAINGRPIYLDAQATTPMDPRVLDKMLPLLTEQYGNPHSRTHAYGWEAEELVENAREEVAKLINAGPKDIVFTSGATESNNMIVKGIANFHKGKKKHIITTQTVSRQGRASRPQQWPVPSRRGFAPPPGTRLIGRSTSVSSTRAVSSRPKGSRSPTSPSDLPALSRLTT